MSIDVTEAECVRCGANLHAVSPRDYEAIVADIVAQHGPRVPDAIELDVERKDGTVEEGAWLAELKDSRAIKCPRCGSGLLLRQSSGAAELN